MGTLLLLHAGSSTGVSPTAMFWPDNSIMFWPDGGIMGWPN